MRVSAAGIYLDWNATTPPHSAVVFAMAEAITEGWANPSSVHGAGRRARALVEDAREAVARLVGVHPRDVLFTSGGTEANNLALRGARTLLVSRLEHPSITRTAEWLEGQGADVTWIPVLETGTIDLDALEESIAKHGPGFVAAVMAANHETGVIQPIVEVARLVHAAGGRLHVDAVQAAGKADAALWEAADSVAVAAHKMRGPKGIGALAWRGPPPAPVLLGGAQERGIRPGTIDPVAAAGFRVAAERAHRDGPERYAALAPLRDRLEAALAPVGRVNGQETLRLPHVSNLSVHGWSGDELVAALDLRGIYISSGSACSAGTTEPSPVITAMVGEERARSAIRISLGDASVESEVMEAIHLIKQVVTSQSSSC